MGKQNELSLTTPRAEAESEEGDAVYLVRLCYAFTYKEKYR